MLMLAKTHPKLFQPLSRMEVEPEPAIPSKKLLTLDDIEANLYNMKEADLIKAITANKRVGKEFQNAVLENA